MQENPPPGCFSGGAILVILSLLVLSEARKNFNGSVHALWFLRIIVHHTLDVAMIHHITLYHVLIGHVFEWLIELISKLEPVITTQGKLIRKNEKNGSRSSSSKPI